VALRPATSTTTPVTAGMPPPRALRAFRPSSAPLFAANPDLQHRCKNRANVSMVRTPHRHIVRSV
jgi:hypothetical protein